MTQAAISGPRPPEILRPRSRPPAAAGSEISLRQSVDFLPNSRIEILSDCSQPRESRSGSAIPQGPLPATRPERLLLPDPILGARSATRNHQLMVASPNPC